MTIVAVLLTDSGRVRHLLHVVQGIGSYTDYGKRSYPTCLMLD